MSKKNLTDSALGLSKSDSKYFLNFNEGEKDPNLTSRLKEQNAAHSSFLKESDRLLQQDIDNYNQSLNVVNPIFESVIIPNNTCIVRLARLPHIDPDTGFAIPRIMHRPSRSGADIQGEVVTDENPYYNFGYVMKSGSDWVPENRYVQLANDAVRQMFDRGEGKYMYVLENGFKFWDQDPNKDSLERFVFIRDFLVNMVFDKKYEPKFN